MVAVGICNTSHESIFFVIIKYKLIIGQLKERRKKISARKNGLLKKSISRMDMITNEIILEQMQI